MQEIADSGDLAASKLKRTEIPENEVVVRAVRLELVPVAGELGCEDAGVRNDLLCVFLELGLGGEFQGDGDGCDGLWRGLLVSGKRGGGRESVRCCVDHPGRRGRRPC